MALYGLRALIMKYGFLDVVASRLHDVVTYDREPTVSNPAQSMPAEELEAWGACRAQGVHSFVVPGHPRTRSDYKLAKGLGPCLGPDLSLCQDTQEHVLTKNL